MRRASLLALALAPALASAQVAPPPAAGQITFPTVALSSTDGFINAAECAAGTITLRWSTGGASPTEFQVYAHNRTSAHNETSTGDCPTSNDADGDTGLRVGQVTTISDPDLVKDPTPDIAIDTSAIVTKLHDAGANIDCNTSADTDIVLCVQARSGTANSGAARGKLVLSTSAPAAPTNVSASPGDDALNISWDEPAGSPPAESYLVDAEQIATTTAAFDPVSVHTSQRLTGTSLRLTGLVNDVVYRVRVFAFSTADNPSAFDPALAVTAMPQPVSDFWETYGAAGGREQGGCGIGGAGPAGLLAIAALLVLRRRS